ncbi:MAG TPA: nucleoside-diphosphate sugar epimerase [Ruminococcaceae bacterium]|nr:nucleoside-diphosphate sugar epimerase [Oscillospiraceae bacterium]HCT16627.1 nucleoside-diphosphate sugar epimerase [Oscillospiraceae bacterium]
MKKPDIKSAFIKSILMMLYDIFAINLSYILVMLMSNGQKNMDVIWQRAIPVTAVFIVLYYAFKIYSSMWEYAGLKEVLNVAVATIIGGISGLAIDIIMSKFHFASSTLQNGCFDAVFYVFGTLVAMILVAGMRIGYRLVRRYYRETSLKKNEKLNRVMIVGAGDMGMIIINELEVNNYTRGKPIIAVDDNPLKVGKRIRGIPVKGTCDQIPELAKKYNIDTIILCLPSVGSDRQTEILRIAVKTGCKLKTSPSLLEMTDTSQGGRIRDVNITDLLSRPEVELNKDVCSYITDQVILVTGGGGSIGSELCRQVSKYHPKKIVVFDIYENSAYLLKQQLDAYHHGNPEIDIRIGSVRDQKRLREIFDEFHPSIVFHAAAHKHVPLMEDSPKEAVKNNVFGTFNVASIAVEYNVKRFVNISSDKAVNPANVMGATKRITEMIVQYFERKCQNSTIFAAVRFGNVLGSSGSVIPIFTEQIKNGGPVTVTHPDITRYFMTIPEAAQLVVQAGGLAKGGEIFVLDMGEPVKIVTLAENLIMLSGYKPYTDIEIQFSGLRPGEKLYEELVLEEESSERKMTANNKIFVTKPVEMDDKLFEEELENLKNATDENVRSIIKTIVPNYKEAKIN